MRRVFGIRVGVGAMVPLLACFFAAAGDASYDSAVAAFEAGDYEQAAKQFESVVEQHPNWAPGLLTLGQCYYLLGRPDDGRSTLEQAGSLDPGIDLFNAYYAVGQTLYQKREYERAIAPLERALDLANPEQRNAVASPLADANLKTKRFAEARRLLEGRDDLEPRSRRHLAIACQRTGDYDRALTGLRSLREFASDLPGLMKDLAQWSHYWALLPANAARRAELIEQALADTRGWLEASPEQDAALRLHSDVLFAAERFEELTAVVQSRTSNDKDCTARLILAKTYNAMRNSTEAAEWAREAISCDGQSADGHLELAVAQMRQVRSGFSSIEELNDDFLLIWEASESVEHARFLAPDNVWAVELADKLRIARDRLQGVADDLAANNAAHAAAVRRLQQEQIRKRCRNILWMLKDETRALSAEDRAYYDEHECKQHATP